MRAEFVHRSPSRTVHFGHHLTARVAQLLDEHRYRRTYVIASPRLERVAEDAAQALGTRCAGGQSDAEMHVPAATVAQTLERFDASGADSVLAIGGGSPIGLAKAIALERNVPIAAVPTTYAGSEMTAIWGITREGVKRTGRDESVRPSTVVYDVELTADMPLVLTLTSGYNAIAHAMEALYAPDSTPLTNVQAEEGVRRVYRAVTTLVTGDESGHAEARTDALIGAWFCGAVLGATTMSLHHKLCHVLGGTFDLPHAATHAVLLPYVLAFNAPAAGDMSAALRRTTGAEDPAQALRDLTMKAGAPTSLRELHMPRTGVGPAVEQACAAPYDNPRDVNPEALHDLLDRAWRGAPQ
ncbi:maleylacetate reductase [Streptomyces canus]|uniref:maleylacetate reductase n=1 Tax=Streptomyces canus TaxID=58343 RepID=UPI0033BCC766